MSEPRETTSIRIMHTDMAGGLQAAYPERPVEHSAFEELPSAPRGGIPSTVREFAAIYIDDFEAAQKSKDYAMKLLMERMQEHAAALATEYPDNISELNDRITGWRRALEEVAKSDPESRELLKLIQGVNHTWTTFYESRRSGAWDGSTAGSHKGNAAAEGLLGLVGQ